MQVLVPTAKGDVRPARGPGAGATLSHDCPLQPDLQRRAAVRLRIRQQALPERVRDEEGQLRVSRATEPPSAHWSDAAANYLRRR